MERVTVLREQAKLMRDLAAKSTDHASIRKRLVALAEQCEQLATGVTELLSKPKP